MTVSTDERICFGNVYEEDFEFPWDADSFDGDEEDWWLNECGYKPSVQLYDEKGEYLNGVKPSEETITAHYAEKHEFKAAHPMPVKLVNYCSGDYPMWILAVPSSVRTNNRGEAVRFDPADLTVSQAEAEALREFCVKYDLIPEDDAGWYLTSYWG